MRGQCQIDRGADRQPVFPCALQMTPILPGTAGRDTTQYG